MPAIGARVRVPVGTRTVTGCVIETGASAPTPDQRGVRLQPDLKDIVVVIDHEPFLPPAIVELCQWVADYYVAGIGDAVAVALPPGARDRASAFRTRRTATLTPHGRSTAAMPAGEADVRLTDRQREALATLAAAAAAMPLSELKERGVTADVVGRLAARGLVAVVEEAHERDPFGDAAVRDVVRDPLRQLTEEQTGALQQLESLADLRAFRVALLHGVTGSGKTEIYLRLAQRVISGPAQAGHDERRRVLMLVPEIALTPSVAALFRSAFGDRVAIQHSALSD